MKENQRKNVVYHYEKNQTNKVKKQSNYDNEFADEFENVNRPLKLEIEQVRKYTNTSKSKCKDKTAKQQFFI